MRNFIETQTREKGFALVTVLMSMLILVFLGIAAMMTMTTEKEIAGAEKIFKDTFYQADNGTSLAAEVLEQNINCPSGFTTTGVPPVNEVINGRIVVLGDNNVTTGTPANTAEAQGSLNFWQNNTPAPATDANRDFYYALYDPNDFPTPYNGAGDAPHTNFTVGGNTVMGSGSALMQAAGYEGKGKGAGAGGAHIVYEIYSQHQGLVNSESQIWLQWRHVIGTEGPCIY